MRRLLFVSLVGVFILAFTVTGWADPSSISVLTGTTVQCNSSGSGGYPTAIQWVVIPPDGSIPTKPTSSEPAFDLMVGTPGSWTINLYLQYEHLVDGSPWSSQSQRVIEAKSVVADLDPGPLQVTVNDTVSLDGSASQISGLALASATFTVDGVPIDGCSFPGPVTDPTDLRCSLPASSLGPGSFVVALEMTDSISGSTDTDQALIEVIEEPPFNVDYLWTPSGSGSLTLLVQLVLSDGWAFSDLESAVWDFGDGSPPEEVTCDSFNFYCEYWSHAYATDGYYDATVTVTTTGGPWNSATHEVTAGDPPPLPTAAFTATPSVVTVNSPIEFSFTGTCLDVCSYLWDFGDGSTSTLLNPTHLFVSPAERQVSLTVSNPTGQDEANTTISVSNCWSPTGGITQTGSCYGAPISLTAPAADAVVWSTGATSPVTLIAAPDLYWAHVGQGTSCWAYVDHVVSLQQCQGVPQGNVNMDEMGQVDAADVQALIRELSDDDGLLVIDSWAGELGAPGADLTGSPGPDGLVTDDDLDRLLGIIFSVE